MAEKKTFGGYIAEVKVEYKYLLKFAVYDMTEAMVDCLETCLKKYELIKASPFRKSPIQENPLDFPNVKNTPVFICDISMGYPASLDFLRVFICNSLNISPQLLAVYSENDPRQIETDLYVDRTSPEFKEKYKTAIGNDYPADDVKPEYGDGYNVGFLQELEKVRKEREVVIMNNPLSPDSTIDHSTLPKDYDSYNDSKNLKKDDVGFFGRMKKIKGIAR